MALAVVVALAVGAAAQPRLGEDLLVDLALLAQLDLRLEDVDLLRDCVWQRSREAGLPQSVAGFHVCLSGRAFILSRIRLGG